MIGFKKPEYTIEIKLKENNIILLSYIGKTTDKKDIHNSIKKSYKNFNKLYKKMFWFFE